MALSALFFVAVAPSSALAQGFVLPGVGAVNRSLAGAGSGAPTDPFGAVYLNPASIAGLEGPQIGFSIEVLTLHSPLTSRVEAGAAGPGIPPVALEGRTDSDGGSFPLPAMAVVVPGDGSRWTYALGFFAVGGFGVNYPASTENPMLTPQPPNGLGLGAIFSRLQVLQVVPTLAYQVTPTISLGFAPTISAAELRLDPAIVATPDDANGDGFASYPSAQGSKLSWGAGVQFGVYWRDGVYSLGGSFKSRQWLQRFNFQAQDELGLPRRASVNTSYPAIFSVGGGYHGIRNWTLMADLRYVGFGGIELFGDPAEFDAQGAVSGIGWRSVWAVALGAQYQAVESWALRLGYGANQSPIHAENAVFSIASPGQTVHEITGGASFGPTDTLDVAIALVHRFSNNLEGPFVSPAGRIPGMSVAYDTSVTALSFSLTAAF